MAMDCIKLPGRVLFLSEDPSKIQRQIHGEDIPLAAALPLRDEVTVDEIAPAWVCYYFGERLEDFPYLGLACGDSFPVTEGAVVRGGFQVVVSGEHHGGHGAREAALFAEFAAGIRLVIAKSFDPEYLQHCHDLGLLTSTDFGLLDLLAQGAELPMERFTRGQDAFTAEIIRNGGAFGFTHARLGGTAVLPVPSGTPRPMTLAEKILARAALTGLDGAIGLPAVAPGDGLLVKADWRFSHETVTNLAAAMLDMFLADQVPFVDPGRIIAFRDHLSFVGRFEGQEGFPEVARRLGRPKRVVRRRRNKLGIPSFWMKREWTAAETALLGKLPDQVVAEKLVRPAKHVMLKRRALRIFFRGFNPVTGSRE